jgi:hypothetical protein
VSGFWSQMVRSDRAWNRIRLDRCAAIWRGGVVAATPSCATSLRWGLRSRDGCNKMQLTRMGGWNPAPGQAGPMLSCPKCNASLPEGMRFCLQCGAPLAAAAPTGMTATSVSPIPSPPVSATAPPTPAPEVSSAPPAAPARLAEDQPPAQAARSPEPTITLKIAPSVVIAPRVDAPPDRPQLEVRPEVAGIDEEALRRVFERPPLQPGTVPCRFCKGPLDLEGEYCEQCGAPVEEAAPPGVLKPKPKPAAPVASPPAAAPAPTRKVVAPAPPVASPIPSLPTRLPITPPGAARYGGPPLASVLPGAKVEPMRKPLLKTRMPMAARPPKPKLAVPEPPPGLMGRLKGLLKTKKVNFPVRYP